MAKRVCLCLGTVLAVALSACGAATSGPAQEAAVMARGGWQETWEGSAVASNPGALPPTVVPCPVEAEPTCHHHQLVVPAGVRQVMVAIQTDASAAEDVQPNDYDLYVYDDQNTLVAYYGDEDGNEAVVFDNTGAAYYDIRVAPFLVVPGAGFTALATGVNDQPIDRAYDCDEIVPENAGLAGVTDDGQRVELGIDLMLDGIDAVSARDLFDYAAEPYAKLGIDLVVKRVRHVTIGSMVSQQIIDESKALAGGRPGAEADIVAVFTSKKMQEINGEASTVIGQADCIGGVRYPERSFVVMTDTRDMEEELLPGINPYYAATAETIVHEIGHLMGAHHHYANCVEGNVVSDGPGDISPCTVMFNSAEGASMDFGLLEGAVVRGHAVGHATP